MNSTAVIHETSRLALCVFEEAHLESSKTFWCDEEVMALCNGATADELLINVIQAYRNCHLRYDLSVYAVKDIASDQVIGAAGFNITGPLEKIELIYHFSKSSWGKGYATEAARACLELVRHTETYVWYMPPLMQEMQVLLKFWRRSALSPRARSGLRIPSRKSLTMNIGFKTRLFNKSITEKYCPNITISV